ncbi:MAG: two pore domain potassium channel family protein [Xanthomonadales bacterium]|nr:two pore domain potassium channel family protein [Xanthomonadales bacterium]
MEFTLLFLHVFFMDLFHAAPLLIFFIVLISFIGFFIGKKEGWSISDSLYHAFINATTVGYGDFRPTRNSSKMLAVVLAFVGIIFAGIVVAMAIHSADYAYGELYKDIALKNHG